MSVKISSQIQFADWRASREAGIPYFQVDRKWNSKTLWTHHYCETRCEWNNSNEKSDKTPWAARENRERLWSDWHYFDNERVRLGLQDLCEGIEIWEFLEKFKTKVSLGQAEGKNLQQGSRNPFGERKAEPKHVKG